MKSANELELSRDVEQNIAHLLELVDLPAALKVEKEKIITKLLLTDAKVPRGTKLIKTPRMDFFITHADELTIIELKIFKTVHDLFSGIAQLLFYREAVDFVTQGKGYKKINCVLVADEMYQHGLVGAMIERYALDVILVHWGEQQVGTFKLKEAIPWTRAN